MEKIKPTVGRMVHFQPRGVDGAPLPPKEAAMIVHVWSDECVNLIVWNSGGTQRFVSSAMLGGDADRWNWPARV